VPFAVVDGIHTRYEVVGSGAPLLMFSPGGFDATLEKWYSLGIYAKTRMMDYLTKQYRCVIFDRRETGQSGGRVERVTWAHYAAQGRELLRHLKIDRAHIMGGCMGCGPVAAFGVAYPEATRSLVLYWPVGGPKYRITGRQRFEQHLAYARQHGLAEVVSLAATSQKSFGEDPRGGPWVSVLRHDRAFAAAYAALDLEKYTATVNGMADALLDRDTAPGAEPEDLMRLELPALVVPGKDPSHATSAARYLEECLPRAEYWDVSDRLVRFLESA